ncbi:Uncharacterised protein [Escherichia coli]|nr:Uncharacterised protein [Escherichia coli]
MTTQTVSGPPLFHESVADGAEIAYRSAGADRDCLDVKPELFSPSITYSIFSSKPQ